MNIFLSPHDDDSALFGAFTCIREKPLIVVCTDSWLQFNRGANITAEERRLETLKAHKILGCPTLRLGVRDDIATDEMLQEAMEGLTADKIYIPALQGGNVHHDMVARVGKKLFPNAIECATYAPGQLYTTGSIEISPTSDELWTKNKALECYETQMMVNRPHFDAVFGRSEWYV